MKTIINELVLLKEKDLLSFATKLIEKIPNPSNAKEYYQSYLKKTTQNNQT